MKVTEESDLVFETESGARYWVKGGYVKRLNPDHEKRGDGKWLELVEYPVLDIGFPAILRLTPLNELGTDDDGIEGTAIFTTRTTTPLTGIQVNHAQ